MMKNISKRWITGLAAMPFLAIVILYGGTLFTAFIGIVAFFTLCEYFRIVFNPKGSTISGILLIFSIAVTFGMLWAASSRQTGLIIALIYMNLIFCGLFSIHQFKSDSLLLENISKQIQGTVYISISLSCLVLIRNGIDGAIWLVLLIGIIFAGDIGAFYTGSYFGRHKLCPSVSPGKTVEGAIGGIFANIGVGSLIKIFFLPDLPWGTSLLFFVSIGLAGQIGDLFESEFKRTIKIKDSGWILPGHGGMLDRIDAILFAAPVTYLFKEFVFV